MNDDLNNIFNGSNQEETEPSEEPKEETEAYETADEAENSDNEENRSEAPVYESRPPVTEGEYRYSGDQLYSEQPGAPEQHTIPNNNPYRNNPYQQQNSSYPYGTDSYYSYEANNSGQQNRNPYSANSQSYSDNSQQYSGNSQQYSGNSQQSNRNPYSQNNYPYQGQRNNYAYPEYPEKKKNGGKIFIGVLAAILVVVLASVVAMTVRDSRNTTLPGNSSNPPQQGELIDNVDEAVTSSSPIADTSVSEDGILTPTQIYKKVLPSSVGVLVYSNSSRALASEGSGVIISEDNDGKYTYILTCAHVISGTGQNIMVQLFNEKEYRATIVGYDSRTDIGVIRIEAHGLQKLEIGDSGSLSVGETIYAIGNPGGTEFANTFTNGMVTALDRPVASSSTGYTMECIQHNAAINPGNSGGALINQYGQLIGINSMKIVSAEYEGMGFAVPSSVFVEVMNDLVVNGYVTNRPKIGISYVKASAEQAYAMFVAIKGLPGGSIVIASVSEDSDFYGKLQVGDLVTSMNGKELDSSADLAAAIEGMKVGDRITLEVVRINRDYSYEEYTVSGVLVEDKETVQEEEESSTSIFDNYFGDSYGSSGGSYGDYFDDFFGGFFGNP
ncbi:MAG: trypsin-like peptidase domain-containing protein [Oscillospiraceae bacterium]|nr:trypsin-like peptidase domain-containing protein [Oscillospiraceae bacterium]